MFLFVFGLPGEFAEWCDRVAVALARHALGPTELIAADTLEEIALNAMQTGVSQAVVSSRAPGGKLRAALVEARQNFVVALDDPGAALVDLVVGRGVDLAEAVQAVASGCGALVAYRSMPGALILRSDPGGQQPLATAAAIARHWRIAMADSEIAETVADLAADLPARPRHDRLAWWNGLPAADQEMATGALLPYIEQQAMGPWSSPSWTNELFFHGDGSYQRAAGPIEVTGRPRCLLCGPYIMLAPGAWSLVLTMLFTGSAAEHEFFVEINADRLLASDMIRPRQEGRASVTIDFLLSDTTEHPVFIRVSSVRAVFDGTIAVVSAALTRPAPAAEVAAPAHAPADV